MNYLPTIKRLVRDERGISILEFALLAPIFLGAIFAALELSQYVIANQRMQRIAANMGDLVAQSGTSSIGASETQMNDILDAMQYAAKPFRLKQRGRVIVTAVQGEEDPADATKTRNRKLWDRCDGQITGQPNRLPGAPDTIVDLASGRKLLKGEILIHSQLVYEYEPLTGINIGGLWDPKNKFIKREASFRPRSTTFTRLTPVPGVVAKDDCPDT